ncbi:hypothetical protein ACOMD4_05830 [Streptomyces anulatus]|uniref:hypothetical protein n=1 Tax=Streptomyces anulatus TaxID=1892 RepID=UPI003B7AD577
MDARDVAAFTCDRAETGREAEVFNLTALLAVWDARWRPISQRIVRGLRVLARHPQLRPPLNVTWAP